MIENECYTHARRRGDIIGSVTFFKSISRLQCTVIGPVWPMTTILRFADEEQKRQSVRNIPARPRPVVLLVVDVVVLFLSLFFPFSRAWSTELRPSRSNWEIKYAIMHWPVIWYISSSFTGTFAITFFEINTMSDVQYNAPTSDFSETL